MDLLKLLVASAFLVHGLIMLYVAVTFLLPEEARKIKERSRFFDGWMPYSLEVVVALMTWGVSGALFVIASVGYWWRFDWWGSVATVASFETLAAVLLWLGVIPPSTYCGAALALGVLFWSFFLR